MARPRKKKTSAPKSTTKKEAAMKQLTYRGKSYTVDLSQAGDKVTVTVEGKPFKAMLHTQGKPEDNYIKLWMCEDAYSMFESPDDLARHVIEHWYQFSKGGK